MFVQDDCNENINTKYCSSVHSYVGVTEPTLTLKRPETSNRYVNTCSKMPVWRTRMEIFGY